MWAIKKKARNTSAMRIDDLAKHKKSDVPGVPKHSLLNIFEKEILR